MGQIGSIREVSLYRSCCLDLPETLHQEVEEEVVCHHHHHHSQGLVRHLEEEAVMALPDPLEEIFTPLTKRHGWTIRQMSVTGFLAFQFVLNRGL